VEVCTPKLLPVDSEYKRHKVGPTRDQHIGELFRREQLFGIGSVDTTDSTGIAVDPDPMTFKATADSGPGPRVAAVGLQGRYSVVEVRGTAEPGGAAIRTPQWADRRTIGHNQLPVPT